MWHQNQQRGNNAAALDVENSNDRKTSTKSGVLHNFKSHFNFFSEMIFSIHC